jgi:hypothetical protein
LASMSKSLAQNNKTWHVGKATKERSALRCGRAAEASTSPIKPDKVSLMTHTKEEIAAGLARGLVFVQRDWANSQERAFVEELIAGEKARGFWAFVDAGYTTNMVRLVRRKGEGAKAKPSRQWLNEHKEWFWERPSKPSMFLLHLCHYGAYAVWTGSLLRNTARNCGQYPTPLTPEFLSDLAVSIAGLKKSYSYTYAGCRGTVAAVVHNAIRRLENPMKPVNSYNFLVDHFLAWHGLAPLPTIIGDEKHWTTCLRQPIDGHWSSDTQDDRDKRKAEAHERYGIYQENYKREEKAIKKRVLDDLKAIGRGEKVRLDPEALDAVEALKRRYGGHPEVLAWAPLVAELSAEILDPNGAQRRLDDLLYPETLEDVEALNKLVFDDAQKIIRKEKSRLSPEALDATKALNDIRARDERKRREEEEEKALARRQEREADEQYRAAMDEMARNSTRMIARIYGLPEPELDGLSPHEVLVRVRTLRLLHELEKRPAEERKQLERDLDSEDDTRVNEAIRKLLGE